MTSEEESQQARHAIANLDAYIGELEYELAKERRKNITPLNNLSDRCLTDSEFWFPEVHKSTAGMLAHFLVGLGGEVGELIAAVLEGELKGELEEHPLYGMMLALMNVGEQANRAKKANRAGRSQVAQDISGASDGDWTNLSRSTPERELPDVLIYLMDIAAALGMDVDKELAEKRAELIALGMDVDKELAEKRAELIERWSDPE